MGNDFDYFEFMQWIFIVIQLLALIIYIYYVLKYAQKFGKQIDFLTISSFIMLVLSIFLKIFLRSIAMIGMNLKGSSLSNYELIASDDDSLSCTYNMSGQLATYFFQLSLFVNSIRWIGLVLSHKNIQLSDLSSYLCKFLIAFELLFITAVTIFNSAMLCTPLNGSDTTYKLSLILFGLGIQIMNIFIIFTYAYSCYFFYQFHKKQAKEVNKFTTNEERLQIKTSSRQITLFFILMILIIILRQIPYMSYMFTQLFEDQKEIQWSAFVYSTLYFIPELALIAVMSQSIKWSLYTYQKYKVQVLDKRETLESDSSLRQRDSITDTERANAAYLDKSELFYAIANDDSFSQNNNQNHIQNSQHTILHLQNQQQQSSLIQQHLLQNGQYQNNSSVLSRRDVDMMVRRINAFSANDNLRSILLRESVQISNERLLNQNQNSIIQNINNRNTGQVSAVPRMTDSIQIDMSQ
eukprot:403366089